MRPIRCLVVEDNQKDLERLMNCIVENEAPEMETVAICDNIRDMNAYLREYQPDLIFLDNHLPGGVHGFDYLETLQKFNMALPPIVMVTLHPPSAAQTQRLQTLGKVLILQKPFDKSEFQEIFPLLPPLSIKDVLSEKTILQKEYITVSEKDDDKIPYHLAISLKNDVLYVQSKGALKHIKLVSGNTVYMWDNFTPFINYGFKQVNKDFVVNFAARDKVAFAYQPEGRQLIVTNLKTGKKDAIPVNDKFNQRKLIDYMNG
jgi:DNA-binding LytR/AlgR family response regulator